LGGIPEADRLMEAQVEVDDVATLSLTEALSQALRAWAIGRWVGNLEEIPTEDADLDELAAEVKIEDILKRELEDLDVEAVVLERALLRKPKYRLLTDDELGPALAPFQDDK